MFDRFLIAPYNTGLQTNLRPWLINDDAWSLLNNAYVFRGRIRKRFGSTYMGAGLSDSTLDNQLYSRLRIDLGTTTTGTAPGIKWQIGQMFSVGDVILTVYLTGATQTLLTTGSVTGTYSTTNGAYSFTGTGGQHIYFYPALPVMGLGNYEIGPINDQPLFGFDTQFAYEFDPTNAWLRSGMTVWKGTNLNFFWTANWRGTTADVTVLFVSNFNSAPGVPPANQDPLWSYDGTNWTEFTPYFLPGGAAIGDGPFVQTALMIFSFKNRLILLNTIEFNTNTSENQAFVNRCRYSFVGSPFAVNAWYERGQMDASGNVAGGAGFTDATTEEAIVSAEFIKDRLIVYFDRSTWELVYTGNQADPFIWQKINTELGSESTFSTIPFDKVILSIANTGVHACNGANVERIDNTIPELIFDIQDFQESENRVCGIRDYYNEMVYWAFPPDADNATYPKRVLVYNYKTGAWALNDDSITAFGYFEQQADTTWANTTTAWNESNFTWIDGIVQSEFRQVVAGNQEGYTFIINSEVTRNEGVLQITNITLDVFNNIVLTIIDHNLSVSDFILVENVQGYSDFAPFICQILYVTDVNTVGTSQIFTFTGTYSGGGTVARVSKISMQSKQFNPYIDKGMNVYIEKVDFAVKRTLMGEITVDSFPSASQLSMLAEGMATGASTGTNVLQTYPYDPLYYPLESSQERLWHTVYFQSSGECIQLVFDMSFDQMINPSISLVDFQLEAMTLYTMPTGRLG